MYKVLQFIYISLFTCILLGTTSLYAQRKKGITIYGSYTVNGSDFAGTKIRLLRNGIKERSNISANGKFEYALEFNNQYELSFSKSGYITKKVVISTDVPERVLKQNSKFPPFRITVELFRYVPGGDYSIFDEPVAMVIYDKELDDFDFDRAYNAEVEEQIKEAEEKIAKAPLAKKEDEGTRLYKELIKKADSELEAKSYINSKKTYREALGVKPEESYPKVQIGLIDKILSDLEKRKKQKEQQQTYYTLIDKADIFFEKKKYSQARSYYVEALEISPSQQHPRDRVKLIDQIFAERDAVRKDYENAVALGDKYFQEKIYESAQKAYEKALLIRKNESYPKEQIQRIERLLADIKSKKEKEGSYNQMIAKADMFFRDKNWFDARDAYERGGELFPKKTYPKDQINKIDVILRTEKKELEQYDSTIRRADSFFEKKNWDNAKQYYEKALAIKSEEIYPQEQIKKIDDVLTGIAEKNAKDKAYDEAILKADRAFKKEAWIEAKGAYFDALKAKPQESYPEERIAVIESKLEELANKKAKEDLYNERLKQADVYYDQKQWSNALMQYKLASEIKPSENYPKVQGEKIERFLKEELERKSVEERENKYKELIADADQAYDTENWDKALGAYGEALQIKTEASYPKNRINAIVQKQKELDREKERQKAYETSISEADSLFNNSAWLYAIAVYDKAKDIKPNETYPQMQIDKVRKKLSAEELAKQKALKAAAEKKVREAYDKAISKADKELAAEHYGLAKQAYRKAISILPKEQYPKDKLIEIDAMFKKKEDSKRHYYQVIATKDTIKRRYYKRINPMVKTEQRYVKRIDATQLDEAKYNELITKAEQAESVGNYSFAKAYYKQAYLEKPSLQLLAKLKELNKKIEIKE